MTIEHRIMRSLETSASTGVRSRESGRGSSPNGDRRMKVLLVEPDGDLRGELAALLQRSEIAVAPFSDPRTAFLFLLARLDELDGVLVNDDEGEWSAWLRRRMEMLPVRLPLASYSGRDPARETRIG